MSIYAGLRRIAFVLALWGSLLIVPVNAADPKFENWIKDFRVTAMKEGVLATTFDNAFNGVDTPDQWVLDRANDQPEFKAPVWQYFDNRIQAGNIQLARDKKKALQPWLDKISGQFGVDANTLMAIWSMESSFGAILDNQKVVRNVVRSLATLAYADPKRRQFGRTQLLAALHILQSGDIHQHHLKGSWAGAMGHTQFIPTSYQAYAVDVDNNGQRDIWNSVPDALGSAANLLAKNGWRKGKTWGYEVTLPAQKLPAGKMALSTWEKLGVKRADGKAFTHKSDTAELKLLDGRDGPAFLVLKNFRVLKRYNNSDRYAVAVGLLADRIGGAGPLSKDWQRPFTPLGINQLIELQSLLKSRGFYAGEIDGKAGSGTRNAIVAFEKSIGLEPKGFPSKEVLEPLRRQ